MKSLDRRMAGLIAVGASVAANCQPCLQVAVAKARASGAKVREIAEAIDVGKSVRGGAAAGLDRFVSSLSVTAPVPKSAVDGGCGCES